MSVSVLNTTASLTGKTLAKLEDSQTFTGAKTFDLGASAPFVVVSGAAKVANLDADKLDGEEATDFHDAAQLTGVLPAAVIAADPNADRVVFWDDSASAFAYLELAGLAIRTTQLVLAGAIPNGRLTLTTATPITTADVTGATTLYYALYGGNKIALYNGTEWENFEIAELSIAVPATTATGYDVFVDYNSGTPVLAVTAWTNLTTRATALTTQDGVLVLTGTLGKRYVGSFRTTGVSGQTEDSAVKRYVWNYYRRADRPLRRTETTATWTYTTSTWRQANGATANQVEVFIGVQEDAVSVTLGGAALNTSGVQVGIGIGLDSTSSAASSGAIGGFAVTNASAAVPLSTVLYHGFPGLGHHTFTWLERSQAAGTTTWYGVDSPNGYSNVSNGLIGMVKA